MNYDYVFTDSERLELTRALKQLTKHPYDDYPAFMTEVRELSRRVRLPPRLVELYQGLKARDFAARPIILFGRSPIDDDLPVFDPEDPVQAKRRVKKQFVTEGFLALHAVLSETEIISHLSVNDGDFFHDIYPKESMYGTQSQKTLETLRFHKDFTNHFVSPDFVNTIVLRHSPENEVYSTFAVNQEVIAALDKKTVATLRESAFYTPFDDISVKDNKVGLGRARDHAAISGDAEIRVFEGRTAGQTPAAQAALDALIAELHQKKIRYASAPGDFTCFSNHHVIHGREVLAVKDVSSLRQRWLMKTHNVFSLRAFEQHFLKDRYGVVNG